MKTLLAIIILAALAWFALIKISDRACEKTYSQQFKQTAQYKAMQCPN